MLTVIALLLALIVVALLWPDRAREIVTGLPRLLLLWVAFKAAIWLGLLGWASASAVPRDDLISWAILGGLGLAFGVCAIEQGRARKREFRRQAALSTPDPLRQLRQLAAALDKAVEARRQAEAIAGGAPAHADAMHNLGSHHAPVPTRQASVVD